jgi:hypothetical protein
LPQVRQKLKLKRRPWSAEWWSYTPSEPRVTVNRSLMKTGSIENALPVARWHMVQ